MQFDHEIQFLRLAIVLLFFTAGSAPAQRLVFISGGESTQDSQPHPVLVAEPPLRGTFFLLQGDRPPPYPFDPFHGALPVYFWDGVYFVDDTGVDYVSLRA